MRRAAILLLAWLCLPVFAAGEDAGGAGQGKALFEQKCAACHTIGAGDRVGPDLRGVTDRQSLDWIAGFISAPEKLIAAKDPVATRLYEKYNRIVMPTLGLTQGETQSLIAYLQEAGAAAAPAAAQPAAPALPAELGATQHTVLLTFLAFTAAIVIVFAWIAMSTGNPTDVDVKRAYSVRTVFFVIATVAVVAMLALTFPDVPYASAGTKADRVVYVAARQFEFVFSDEPVTTEAELTRVATRRQLDLPAGTLVEFRVTALDVTHGFGVYGPHHELIAQTQAMPGYVNRLLVRLPEAGSYQVLCLEYCAAGHHLMRTGLTVK